MIAHGPGRFRFQQAERRWPSVIVSVVITALSFVLAFGSMWSIPGLTSRERPTQDAIATIQLPPPAPPRPEVAAPPRVAKQPAAETPRQEPPSASAVTPPSVAAPSPVASPVVAPVGIPPVVRDSSATTGVAATDSASRGANSPRRSGKGAPMEPAGISLANRAANTPQVRDSIIRSKMELIPGVAATREPTGRERAELEQSQRSARALRARDLSGGNSRDLVVLQGKGMNGVGAVTTGSIDGGRGFVVSIPFTLFSSGPTREQRKKNEAIDADYQLRLRRLEDRMYLKRDSIRADSIRADSLRRRGNPSSP